MQDEGEALGGSERLEDDEQRQPDGVGDQRLLLGVGRVVDRDERLGEPRADVVLVPRRPGAEHVETDAPDDGPEPAAEVVDGAIHAVQPQPCLLHGVVALADRAEHAVGDRPQERAMLLELGREPVALDHQRTAVRVKTRMPAATSTVANSPTTSRLSDAIAAALCMPQMLWRLAGSSSRP